MIAFSFWLLTPCFFLDSLREREEEEEETSEVVPRGPRRRKGLVIPEYSGDGPEGATSPIVNDHAASLAQARREMRLAQKRY